MRVRGLPLIWIWAPTLLLTGLSCSPRDVAPEQPYREAVRVVRAESRPLQPRLESFGTIVYLNKADVFPTTEGVIESIAVEEGMRVRKGDVLAVLNADRLLVAREQIEAELESRQARLALAEEKLREGRKAVEARILAIAKARAELAQRRAEFENVALVYANKRELHGAGGIADGELETVRTRYVAAEMQFAQAESDLQIQMIGLRDEDLRSAGLEPPQDPGARYEALVEINTRMLAAERAVAQAELNGARSELRRIEMSLSGTSMRAPIEGIVAARLLDPGESASPDTLLFTLFNTDAVFVQLELSEADLTQVHSGQEAAVRPDGSLEPAVLGIVQLISPYINPQSRTARVRIRLDNPSGRFVPGMFVRVAILLGGPEERVVVPETALLVNPEEKAEVFVLRGGRIFRTAVVAGQKDGDFVVIRRGLDPGETVVLAPSPSYPDGLEVEVEP